jgi:hypothetical protein
MKQKLITICCIALTSLLSAKDQFLQYSDLNQLVVLGNVNVILGESKSPNLVEYDDSEVSVNMFEGILTLNNMSGSVTNIVVRSLDQFKNLARISIKDQSTLVAKDLRSDALSVDANTSGNIKIEGVMNLNRLMVDSAGEIEIYWVDSDELDVDIKQGNLVLGGRANRLVMRATDQANLDARGLIANDVWVAALDKAMVQVFPLRSLFAYSRDKATVDVKYKPEQYVPINQAPSVIVLNYIDMEKRTGRII